MRQNLAATATAVLLLIGLSSPSAAQWPPEGWPCAMPGWERVEGPEFDLPVKVIHADGTVTVTQRWLSTSFAIWRIDSRRTVPLPGDFQAFVLPGEGGVVDHLVTVRLDGFALLRGEPRTLGDDYTLVSAVAADLDTVRENRLRLVLCYRPGGK